MTCFKSLVRTLDCLLLVLTVGLILIETVDGEVAGWNTSRVKFVHPVTLERPKCKSHLGRQKFQFHWRISNHDISNTVSCFFFPETSSFLNHTGGEVVGDLDGILNSTATLINSKKSTWSCDAWLHVGVWIPLLGYSTIAPSISTTQRSHLSKHELNCSFWFVDLTTWTFSGIHLHNRIVRSKIQRVYPRLLMANSLTQINLEGVHFESPIRCQVTPLLDRASHSIEAKITNASLASCQVYGPEGIATLKIQWDTECSVEFEIEFLLQPNVWRVYPSVLPHVGNSIFEVHLRSGQLNVEDSLTMFLPQRVDPVFRLQCSGNISFHKAEFTIVSDDDWLVNTTLRNISRASYPTRCTVSVSLNARDYFSIGKTVIVHEPEVGFLSRKMPVVIGGNTKLWVNLDRPVTVPVSVAIMLVFSADLNNNSQQFELSNSVLHWESREVGPKAVSLMVNIAPENQQVIAKLRDPVNCDLNLVQDNLTLITLEEENVPVFHIQTRKVFYPGDTDAFTVDVILIQGLTSLKSVLEYAVSTRQLNTGCQNSVKPDFLRESDGQIEWTVGRNQQSVPIHINWENITFCDELEVLFTLKGVEMARIQQEENTVARIYGTPKGICPPGTVTRSRDRDFDFIPGDDYSDLSLSEIKIEGVHVESDGFYDTELVPPFIKTHSNYTAMIPYDMKKIKMKIIKQGTNQEIRILDESCSIDVELDWKEQAENTMEAEVIMNHTVQHCSLEVVDYYTVESYVEPELDDLVEPSAPAMEDITLQSGFAIEFLQLSDPHLAQLRSVEIRNTTHLVSFCGPKDDPGYLSELSKDHQYQVVEGYPKNSCHFNKHNYIHEVLLGDELFIIPRLERPEIQTTKIEVSGIFLRGFNELDEAITGEETPESENETDEMILAAAFGGVPMTLNTSFSFDIRITAEDTVTSNLYRFVYGNPKSKVQLYPSGSSFDLEHQQSVSDLNDSSNSSGIWPLSPADYDWCSQCSSGSFSVGVDTLECALCPPGHYSSISGNSQCTRCPAGSFSYTWGSQICRPCMIGSAANKAGSEYCQLCPDGYMTDREGAAHCTVSVRTTDLRTSYAIIASFGVVLNGTSLEEVERLGTVVHGSGILVLKTLIRTDMADALNISVGDVAVTKVSPYGERALLVNVDTTFKVDVDDSAEPEEVDARVAMARLRGDHAVYKVQTNPDGVLRRTTQATHSHAHMNAGAKIIAHKPSDQGEELPWYLNMTYAVISICILFCSCTCLLCLRFKKQRRKKQLPRYHVTELGDFSKINRSEPECQVSAIDRFIRQRPASSYAKLEHS